MKFHDNMNPQEIVAGCTEVINDLEAELKAPNTTKARRHTIVQEELPRVRKVMKDLLGVLEGNK